MKSCDFAIPKINLYTENDAIVIVEVSSTLMPVNTWSVRIIPTKKGKIAVKKITYLLRESPKA